ncbi:MAG: hypothetical protein I8H75_02100 [Myxococcaceae bacterium]|nr:hypothetical protein [Myxococcaceae bacterium]
MLALFFLDTVCSRDQRVVSNAALSFGALGSSQFLTGSQERDLRGKLTTDPVGLASLEKAARFLIEIKQRY